MILSQPPPSAVSRAHQLAAYGGWPPPGQRLPDCTGHSFIDGGCCQGVSTFHVLDSTSPTCWLKVRRRKDYAAEYRRAMDDRRHQIDTGYRNLARFEAATHWHLCIARAMAEAKPLLAVCTCPASYRSWFADQMTSRHWSIIIDHAHTGSPP